MSNSINKKMAELLGKMDEKVLQAKLSATIDMLKKGDMDDLVKKINKMDKNELLSKINEDENKTKRNRKKIKQK